MTAFLFILFAGLARAAPSRSWCSAIRSTARFPWSASSSRSRRSTSCLAAPFIAAVQVIVYAGAIMVLVVFVIMLLNVEEEERRRLRLRFLVPTAVILAARADCRSRVCHLLRRAQPSPQTPAPRRLGLTASIGTGLFTTYLLPFEITSVLLLMAIVGAMTLARRASIFRRALCCPRLAGFDQKHR